MTRATWGQVGCWLLLAAAFLGLTLAIRKGVFYGNDTYQYFSVADNLAAGRGPMTSILYFDEQFYTGLLPAPQTVFPPGYPLLIAALQCVGLPRENAGEAVSAVAFLVLIPLLIYGWRRLKVHPWAVPLLLFLLVANAAGWRYGLAVLSESLFTALTLLSLLTLMRAEDANPGARMKFLVFGAVLAALTYWVRNAGCFLVAAVVLYYAVRAAARRDRRGFVDLAVTAATMACVVSWLLWRNVAFSGHWQGGNTKPVSNPLVVLMRDFRSACFSLAFGDQTRTSDLVPRHLTGVLASAVLVGVGLLLAAHLVVNRRAVLRGVANPLIRLPLTYLLVYLAAMFYCGLYTVIDFDDPRMFYPLVPVELLLLGVLFPQESKPAFAGRWFAAGTFVLMLGAAALFAAANIRSMILNPDRPPHEPLLAWLAEPATDGESVQRWIDVHVSPTAAVAATEGQACGYLLRRPTVGLAGPRFSSQPWTESRFREVASSYHLSYLIVFPASSEAASLSDASPFLRGVLDGDPPDWVALETQSEHCKIYRLTPDAVDPSAASTARRGCASRLRRILLQPRKGGGQ